MAKYDTQEKFWDCWGCGCLISWYHMWTPEDHPRVKRCPNCNENMLTLYHGSYVRCGSYNGKVNVPEEYINGSVMWFRPAPPINP